MISDRQNTDKAFLRLAKEPSLVPRRSERLWRWFQRWLRRYVARHFHAVRICREPWPVVPSEEPLLVVLNHPSWWDPLIGILLTELFPGRRHYAPMAAAALARYPWFERLGFYPVTAGTLRGAADFLATTLAILTQPGTAVWLTAQGQFVDPRVRPVVLRSGVAHVARRLTCGRVLPLALEYPFWEERLPEALAGFGTPLPIAELRGTAPSWRKRIAAALEAAQDTLAAAAQARNPRAFVTLLQGHTGVHRLYDWCRWLRACWRGQPFHAQHGASD
jgi:1-acyl-sn-glycerol-3-phosphate acyltransferase